MPRVQFTVRRMMIAVAVLALLISIATGIRRRERMFGRLVDYHRNQLWKWEKKSKAQQYYIHGINKSSLDHILESDTPMGRHAYYMAKHHSRLVLKYMAAARHPWLPVAPDPPEPE